MRPTPLARTSEAWRTSGDGFRSGTSPHDRFAHTTSIGFCTSICADVTALNPWSAALRFVGVRFMVSWVFSSANDGFPIHQEVYLVFKLPTVYSSRLINTWIEFRGYRR
jgi:hypothetical protein